MNENYKEARVHMGFFPPGVTQNRVTYMYLLHIMWFKSDWEDSAAFKITGNFNYPRGKIGNSELVKLLWCDSIFISKLKQMNPLHFFLPFLAQIHEYGEWFGNRTNKFSFI